MGEADLAIEVTRVEEGGAEIDDAKDRKQAFLDMLDRIWAMPRTGVRPTREEVDAYVEDLRGDWD